MKLQAVRGTHDLIGETASRFRWIVQKLYEVADCYGYGEVQTPIFEFSDVFKRTLGDLSDVVTKEMYTFTDRGGDELTLRPEGTAGIARAYISEGWAQNRPLKLFYFGPMFRYERPQKGRQRQFHQIGVELLGIEEPMADTEILSFADNLLKALKIDGLCTLNVNTLGDSESRASYKQALVTYLEKYAQGLSLDSQARLKVNPLRILDSKDPKDQEIIRTAPELKTYLNTESRAFYDRFLQNLNDLNISFVENTHLVRGLDYYTHVVFEFRTTHLGSQDAVLAGGRYDKLIEQMGGPVTPGTGWAAGIERLALLLTSAPQSSRPMVLVPLGERAEREAQKMAHRLRGQNLPVELGFSGNLSKRMKRANKLSASHAVIFGDQELDHKTFQIKDLTTGTQIEISESQLDSHLRSLAQSISAS